MIELLHDDKAALIGFDKIDAAFLDAHPTLKVIGSPTTGLDHVDLAACEKRGVQVISLKGEIEFLKRIPSVAELTIWFMLELLRKPHEYYLGQQLKGKKVLIWGLGRIGKQVKKRLTAFEAKIITGDKGDKLEDLLDETVDILTVHVPLDETTKGSITGEHLNKMRDGALVVNTARSQIFELSHLQKAIQDKNLGYGTDVVLDNLEFAWLQNEQRLGRNIVLTSHVGGHTREARGATDNFIKKKIDDFFKNLKI